MAGPHYAIMRVQRLCTIEDLEGATRHGRREDTGEHYDPSRTPFNRHWAATPVDHPVDWVQGVDDAIKRLGAIHRQRSAFAAEFLVGASPEYFLAADGETLNLTKTLAWADANMTAFYNRFDKAVVAARLDLDEATPHLAVCVVPTYTKITVHTRSTVVSYRKVFGGENKHDARDRLIAWQDWYAGEMAPLGLVRGVPKALTNRRHLTHQDYARERRREDDARKAALREAEARLLASQRLEALALEKARKATRTLLDAEKALAFMEQMTAAVTALDATGRAAAAIAAKQGTIERWKNEVSRLIAEGVDGEQGDPAPRSPPA